jgi:uncharacterized metal-binding protein YceD (DUF177 family)
VWEGDDTARYDPSEVQVIPASLPVIDVNDDVRQTVFLAVPLKLLCSESCKGLCPQCGINLNMGTCACTDDPADGRWEKLRSLVRKTSS